MSSQPKSRSKQLVLLGVLCLVGMAGCWGYRQVLGTGSFDAERIAAAETKMWQAYYSEDHVQLGLGLVVLLRGQFGLSPTEARDVGESLAKAALKFQRARGNYDQAAMPDLVHSYTVLKTATGRDFDPEEAARLELDWWVARRTPGRDSPEQVGAIIADLYAHLHGGRTPGMDRAGLLRAQAAALRDEGGASADWQRVEALLVESYEALGQGL